MKRLLILIYFLIFGLSIGFAQDFFDDLYVSPTEAKSIQNQYLGEKTYPKSGYRPIKKKKAKEIIFIDQYGNPTTNVSDTLYIVDNNGYEDEITSINDSILPPKNNEKSYEYARRIEQFHRKKDNVETFYEDNDYEYDWDNNYDWNNYAYDPYYTYWGGRNHWLWRGYWPTAYDSFYYRTYHWGYLGWHNPLWYSTYYNPWYTGYYAWGGGYYDGYYSGYQYGLYHTNNYYNRENRIGNSKGVFSNTTESRRTNAVQYGRTTNASTYNKNYTTVSRSSRNHKYGNNGQTNIATKGNSSRSSRYDSRRVNSQTQVNRAIRNSRSTMSTNRSYSNSRSSSGINSRSLDYRGTHNRSSSSRSSYSGGNRSSSSRSSYSGGNRSSSSRSSYSGSSRSSSSRSSYSGSSRSSGSRSAGGRR